MKQFFTPLFGKAFCLIMPFCLLLLANGAIAQTTATEEFENETNTGTFSESGINFTYSQYLAFANFAGYGYSASARFLDMPMSGTTVNTTSGKISINTSLNPGTSFKINSFAGYVSSSSGGAVPYNGEVTVSGTPVGSSTAVSTIINIASGSGTLPSGQTRESNGFVNGLNFTGTPLAGLYFTQLTFTINDCCTDGAVGTRDFSIDHINFTTAAASTNQYSIADASVLEGSSGTKFMTFTITRSQTTAAGSVQVQSNSNSPATATAGTDYMAFPLTTVNFSAGGAATQTVNVTINGDLTAEADETFFMVLSNPGGGSILDGTATGTILDDDNITETFEDETVTAGGNSTVRGFSERGFSFLSNGDLFVSRGANLGAGNCGCTSTALDTRTNSTGSSGNVGSFYTNMAGTSFDLKSVDVYPSNNDGTSGTTTNVNITFTGTKADGLGNVTYTAVVPPISGYNYQTVSFTGTPFANVQLLSVSITIGTGVNYIALDNIRYGTVSFSGTQLSIDDVNVVEGTGGGTSTALFTVTRSSNSTAFSVNVATSDVSATAGSDYVMYNATLNFTAGGPLTQTVPITILRDAVIESNETFNVTLSGATNGVLYQKPVGVCTILDDDKVTETFEDEINAATTFSENGVAFSSSGRLKVVYSSGGNNGAGQSSGYLSSGYGTITGSVGKVTITTPNTGFKLLQLDLLTYTGTTPSTEAAVTGPVTFIGTLFNGTTVSVTKTISPTNTTGTGFQRNITFTGTALDNVVLTALEFSSGTGSGITSIDIDNFTYVSVATVPYAEVTDAANVAIPNGSAASTANNTDFGSACTSGSAVSKTFTIKNTGAVNLTLSGSPIAVLGGTNANQFSITTQPTSPVAAGGSTTFTVSYLPTAAATHNATVTFSSNDAANSPYVINLRGTGNTPPAVTNPSNAVTCAGSPVSFSATGSGSGTLSYQWYRGTTALANGGSSNISGAMSATLTISNPGTSDAATDYNVKVSSTTGCTAATSANASLTVNPAPSFTAQPTVSPASGICTGSTITLSAGFSNVGSVSSSTAQWFRGTSTTPLTVGSTGTGSTVTNISTSTSSASITITNVGAADSGNYVVKITSSTGCGGTVISNPVSVNVSAPTIAAASTTGTRSIDANNYVITNTSCTVIAKVQPAGASPISGSTTAAVTVQSSVQVYSTNGSPYAPRYYDITPATNAATATATLTLYYNQSEFTAYNAYPGHGLNLPVDAADAANYKANIRIYQFHGSPNGSGTFPGAATETIDPADANIIYNGIYGRWEITFNVTGFSRFYLASAGSTILPLDLLSFVGSTDGSNVWLQWKTANEREVSYFEIERSSDAQHFEKIGQLSAGGNTYRATDKPGANPTYYYRLKIVDKDGRYSYSNVVAVNMKKATMVVQAMPNPFKDRLLVQITAANTTKVELRLLEMSGKTILKKTVALQPGINTISLDETATLAKGAYLLQVAGEKVNRSLNVIKAE